MKSISSNVWLLALIQPLVISTGGLNSVIAGLIGFEMTGNEQLATLPVGALMLGVALFVFPASKLQERFGRKTVFVVASLISSIAGLLAIFAVENSAFILYVAANFLFGTQLAVIGQYRYAAMESCSDSKLQARAVSTILIGGISSAIIGPELIEFAKYVSVFSSLYSNAYFIIVLFHLTAALLLALLFSSSQLTQDRKEKPKQRLQQAFNPSMYRLAILIAATAYGVMAMVMTATPLAMKGVHFDIEQIKIVIQSHILAMYLPSLISAQMIERLGIHKTLITGAFFLFLALVSAMISSSFYAFIASLVCLGIGWNMLFLSGTTLLPQTYSPSERFKSQGRFDFSISVTQTVSASVSGMVFAYLGWVWMQLLCLIPIIALVVISLRYLDEFPKLTCCNDRLVAALSKRFSN